MNSSSVIQQLAFTAELYGAWMSQAGVATTMGGVVVGEVVAVAVVGGAVLGGGVVGGAVLGGAVVVVDSSAEMGESSAVTVGSGPRSLLHAAVSNVASAASAPPVRIIVRTVDPRSASRGLPRDTAATARRPARGRRSRSHTQC